MRGGLPVCPWCSRVPEALLFGKPPLCSHCNKPVILRLVDGHMELLTPDEADSARGCE